MAFKRNGWIIASLTAFFGLPLACTQHPPTYTPGLGEFMSGIQVHHEKLWFAGKAGNWQLADFETGEIRETIDDIQKYCTTRPEVTSLPMIMPALDSLDAAVKKEDTAAFKRGFLLLTTTCNNCHQVTKHGYNVIRQPTTPPFSNQLFSPTQKSDSTHE